LELHATAIAEHRAAFATINAGLLSP